MKKSAFAMLGLLTCLSLILAACQPATTATPEVIVQTSPPEVIVQTAPPEVIVQTAPPEVVPAERVEVRLSGWASSPSETALLESLLYRFSVENPDIVVKYEPITGDFMATINTMVATGEEPDIYYMDIFQFPAFAQNEVLMPLDDLMGGAGTNRDDFIPALIDAFTVDGVTYGIPKDFNTLGLFYNKTMFADAGLEEPTDDWTWDDLKEASTALSDPANNVYGFGVPNDPGRFPVFVFQNGGSVMTDDFSDTTLDSAEAVDAAAFYTGFRADGSAAIPSDVDRDWQGTAFGEGEFGMVYEGGWLIPYLRDNYPGVEYGVVQPPAGPAGEGNLIFTVAYVMSANSEHPEEAMRVIDFLTNEASQTTVLESGFALPSRSALEGSEYFTNNPNSAAIFRGAGEGARPFMWGVVGSDVNEQMGKALERVYLEEQPVNESLAQAAEEIRAKIAEAG